MFNDKVVRKKEIKKCFFLMVGSVYVIINS